MFVKISIRRRHALLIDDGVFSQDIDYVTIFEEILNPEGHLNLITGSKVTTILHVGGVASGRVCAQPANQACFLLNRQFSLGH